MLTRVMSALLGAQLLSAQARADLPPYQTITIAGDLKMGYQLVAADLNRDGKLDLIAVDERGTELAWYENPTWERHVIVKDGSWAVAPTHSIQGSGVATAMARRPSTRRKPSSPP